MADLRIEYIAVDKLTPYKDNSKIHTKEQIRHIANSIEKFGFNDPLGICGADNIVLEGNGRIEAAKLLKLTTLPCVRLDHLSEKEQRAYVIAHNSLNLETGFDDAVLFAELKKLQDHFDMEGFGVDTDKFKQTLDKLEQKELKPYGRAHYLITIDINDNDKIVDVIDKLRNMDGVEVNATIN